MCYVLMYLSALLSYKNSNAQFFLIYKSYELEARLARRLV